jgi:hypothetical protein
MRVILAGLFVFIGLSILVGVSGPFMERLGAVVMFPIMLAAFFGLLVAANAIFNSDYGKRKPHIDADEQYREWIEQGLITKTKYVARRAFEVEEFEDEGKHFFLELEDSSVLYLNGQYLYDLVDPLEEVEQPRFPCKEFAGERHANGLAVNIRCEGSLLDYITLDSTFWDAPYWKGDYQEDGLIITDQTFDQLKQFG